MDIVVVVVTGLDLDKRKRSRAFKCANDADLCDAIFDGLSTGYAKVVRSTPKGVVGPECVDYFKIEMVVTAPDSSRLEKKTRVTEELKKKTAHLCAALHKHINLQCKAPIQTGENYALADTGWSLFSSDDKKGYAHWYSLLDGVYRPCVNGFRMMGNLHVDVAVSMLNNACKLARMYVKQFDFKKRLNKIEDELVLTVAFRFLSGPYGTETGNDDRSLWGVMTDREQKDCDDLTMVACAVVYAIKNATGLDLTMHDPALEYLHKNFTRAFFVQGEATPNTAKCKSGGHVFMILTRSTADGGGPVTTQSFRNGLLVECTTPMIPPGWDRVENDGENDTGKFVCALKRYDLEKYTSVVALYTPLSMHLVKTDKGLGVPATDLLTNDPTGNRRIHIHTNEPFVIEDKLIAKAQSDFFYEYYDETFVAQLRAIMKLGEEEAIPGVLGRASWGRHPKSTSNVCFSYKVGGGTWSIFFSPDAAQRPSSYLL